jgi:hypothetical protein
MVDNTEQDDGIIELTQLVEEDLSDGSDQEMIELTDIHSQPEEIQVVEMQVAQIEETDLGLELDLDDGQADTDDIILLEDRDVSFDSKVSGSKVSGSESSGAAILVPDSSSSIESTITQEQVEAALERVIEKKFAAIIEQNLGEVMEKVLELEIADIRKRLQADLDEMVIS